MSRAGKASRNFCLNWLLERQTVPGIVVAVGASLAAIALNLGATGVLALNVVLVKVPQVTNFGRALLTGFPYNPFTHNWQQHDWSKFSRPMSHQGAELGPIPEQPLELQKEVKGVPRWLNRVVDSADHGNWLAARFDDWLSQRSRVTSFTFEALTWAIGFAIHVPFLILMPAIVVIDWVPFGLSAYLALRSGDLSRVLRPGSKQRSDLIRDRRRRLGLDQSGPALVRQVEVAASATPSQPPTPMPWRAPSAAAPTWGALQGSRRTASGDLSLS